MVNCIFLYFPKNGNLTLATNSDFLIPISFPPETLKYMNFKFWLLDLAEFVVRNFKGWKTSGCKNIRILKL